MHKHTFGKNERINMTIEIIKREERQIQSYNCYSKFGILRVLVVLDSFFFFYTIDE